MSKKTATVRSMTGYARVRKSLPEGELVISLRGVNHRGLDLHFYLPPELDPFENGMRALLAQNLARGHVDVRVSWTPASRGASGGWNRALMAAYLEAFREAAEEYHLSGEPDLNSALRLPGMLREPEPAEPDEMLQGRLLEALGEAVEAFNEFRSREGEATARVLEDYGEAIRKAAGEIARIRAGMVPFLQARLETRLSELLRNTTVEPQRIIQEAAILAERSDIGEEVTRLEIHAGQLHQLLRTGGEVGKKMEFLLQEMHREVNTILAKSTGCGEPGRRITELALSAKSLIEKSREQSLNLE